MLIKRDFTAIADPARREKYLQLIADGSPEAIAAAGSMSHDAAADASMVKTIRKLLANRPAVVSSQAEAGKVARKIASIDDQIAELQRIRGELAEEKRRLEQVVDVAGWLRAVHGAALANLAARTALKRELAAAGVEF